MRDDTSKIETPADRAGDGRAPGIPMLNLQYLRTTTAARWIVVFLALLGAFSAGAQISREYELKAAFLYNFARFTDWPPDAFGSSNAPIVIGVLGADPFGQILNNTVRGEQIGSHPILVEHYGHVEDIKTCHILFISQSEARRLNDVVKNLAGRPTLTVSDIEHSAWRGVMVGFVTENNKIRLKINVEAIRAAKLTMSSQLLRLSDIVGAK